MPQNTKSYDKIRDAQLVSWGIERNYGKTSGALSHTELDKYEMLD